MSTATILGGAGQSAGPKRLPSAYAPPASGNDGLVTRGLRIVAGIIRRSFAAHRGYHKKWRDARHLDAMSDHMLNDIGLTRSDVRSLRPTPFFYL